MPSPTQEAPAEAAEASNRVAGPLRFSLRSLIIGVTITAVACMAFRTANEIWATVLSTLLLGAVITAVILAIYSDLNQRPWRVGFVITAVLLGLVSWMYPPRDNPYGSVYPGMPTEPLLFRLVTGWALNTIRGDDQTAVMQAPSAFNPGAFNPGTYAPASTSLPFPSNPGNPIAPYALVMSRPTLIEVHNVADPLWIFAIAILGGIFASWVDQKRRSAATA